MTEYNEKISDFGELMELEEFLDWCRCQGFIDYDGSGNFSNGKMMGPEVYPSMVMDYEKNEVVRDRIPEDATHVVWFNR